jgi:hypothetical protein
VDNLLDKELKLITNNFTKFENANLKHHGFLLKYIAEFECWPELDRLEDSMKNPFYILRTIMKSSQKGVSKADIDRMISKLVDIEKVLLAERLVIKDLRNIDDLIYGYDAILKRSLMRTRKMITVLTHFV